MSSTQATPYFVALAPDEATAERIWRHKMRVQELVGDQQFLDHPPHMTLYLAMFGQPDDALRAARDCAHEIEAPQLSVEGWHTFLGDSLTGHNTLVYDFTAKDRAHLRSLQSRIVAALADGRDANATLERINGRLSHLSPQEHQAALRWGFPYVGEGWHPHFTIASIRPTDWPIVERELLMDSPAGTAACPKLQVFRLVDNEPELVESFELAKRSSTNGHSRSGNVATQQTGGDLTHLKDDIVAALWNVVDAHDWILSATVTGSFLTSDTLDAISDIDLVIVADHLNRERYDGLQEQFETALRVLLDKRELGLRINPTLGPRKLNDHATAVLHLMLYSREAHHQHAIKSPFTCLDWQRSTTIRKRSLAEIYPVFGLQPHHFVSARRGIRDYLHDFERGVVSYRELECSELACHEAKREEPMSVRDRYEYAYHVLRFLMQNLLKLVDRQNCAHEGQALLDRFFAVFPQNEAAYRPLYQELWKRKKARDFSQPIETLSEQLCAFVLDFESQFRVEFIDTATRHIVFRHAPTRLNGGEGDARRFVGRTDLDIEPVADGQLSELIEAVTDFPTTAVYVSPLSRCRQSLEQLAAHVTLPNPLSDERLLEIDYGTCEGKTVGDARASHPELFAAWERGEDRAFPEGERSADVATRLESFIDDIWRHAEGNMIACTHNVVLRAIVGQGLSIPIDQWHRIHVPHLAPITVVQTRRFGWFVDLEESVERPLLSNFLYKG